MRGDKSGSRQKEEREQKEALQEELLSEAFNACMEEQLSFIPPEREIARMHTFSEEFNGKAVQNQRKAEAAGDDPERICLRIQQDRGLHSDDAGSRRHLCGRLSDLKGRSRRKRS